MKIKCKDIFKKYRSYNTKSVINGASFELESGNSLSISGPSGVGKSTLLNVLAGIDVIDKGEIFFDDVSFTNLSDSNKTLFRLNNISHIFQSPNLLMDFNVTENIMIPLIYQGNTKYKSKSLAIQCLEEVNLIEHLNSPVSILSGGEAQRVGIARAMAMKSKIILADEPTGNLDSDNAKLIFKILFNLKNKNRIIIFATHNRYFANMADCKITMNNGNMNITNAPIQKKIF